MPFMMRIASIFMNMDKRIGSDFEKGLAKLSSLAGSDASGATRFAMDATIAPLWGHRELAPLLARWHHDEFGYLYDARIWNREIAMLELEAMAEPGRATSRGSPSTVRPPTRARCSGRCR